MVWKGKLGYKDLVRNIMNYGDDTCSTDITQGQVNRWGITCAKSKHWQAKVIH